MNCISFQLLHIDKLLLQANDTIPAVVLNGCLLVLITAASGILVTNCVSAYIISL